MLVKDKTLDSILSEAVMSVKAHPGHPSSLDFEAIKHTINEAPVMRGI